ncbi:MAG: sigma-70 family RNA polymerase sigma factor [Phycisphaerales bacterium]
MLSRTTHATLLERLTASEDHAAWREFCDRYGGLIAGVARRAGCDPNDAEDVLQDVLTSLVSAMPGFRYDPAKGRFRGYLKAVTMRAISRRRRQNGPAGALQVSGNDDAVTTAADTAADRDWEAEWRQYHLRMAMRTIDAEFSTHDRAAFDRYAVQGLGVKETASALGLTVDQVYQAKSRIVRRLSELIAEQVADEG